MGNLGILLNTDRHRVHLLGLVRAARARGHLVHVFVMDEGTRMFRDASFVRLASLAGVNVSVCQHSAEHHGVALDALPPEIVRGSQLNNAMMQHGADRVVVL